MATTRTALTDNDIRALIKGPTAHERASAAIKICSRIEDVELTVEERTRAHEILRLMANDAAELVRQALAATLSASQVLPRDVAMLLAKDVESIAVPVLNFSPVFTDSDLREIVRLGDPVRQVAIASRPALSEAVTDSIAELGVEKAVETACGNDNAKFSELGLQKVLERFSEAENVLRAVAYRQILPLSVTERLITLVSDQVREHLINRHNVAPAPASEISVAVRERASIDLVDQAGRTADVKAFVKHLIREERLSASLLLRALAHGHMPFVEHGIAELSGVPHHRAWLMVHDAGPLGLKAIYERAGLPARLYPAFRAAVDTYHGLEYEGGLSDREKFQSRMLERFLSQPQPVSREDMDYLVEKLDQARSQANHRLLGAA